MRDIVATIQAEQDEIIRLDHPEVLVIEGGPGTGKTVVALHRVILLGVLSRQRGLSASSLFTRCWPRILATSVIVMLRSS